MAEQPLAIEVRDLKKSFRIPVHRVDSFKERMVRPFAARDSRELRALDGVSFDIGQGEFFGIVGRNGSGKSTLLKLLASIYRKDAGLIRMAGRLAPFIELGVGFNVELTARENVVLNGVMMGLTPKETRERLDSVLDFAELHEFGDLKLKNYSSGMLVRLAFSTMMEADADILLIDEVLAVGDAAFQQKCADAFREMKAAGKTIVLVTHEMATVEEYCHRAMLIEDGHIRLLGKPEQIGREYLRLNFQTDGAETDGRALAASEGARLLGAWIEGSDGARASGIGAGDPIRLRAEIELTQEATGIAVGFTIDNADGVTMFQLGEGVSGIGDEHRIAAGKRILVQAEIENQLAPGRYYVHCGVQQDQGRGNTSLYEPKALDFVVFGSERSGGVIAPRHEMEAKVEKKVEA
jgi:ABC-2 type transport system ATP-binding protein